jgi:DNA-binding Lrp family transcriptional regulator
LPKRVRKRNYLVENKSSPRNSYENNIITNKENNLAQSNIENNNYSANFSPNIIDKINLKIIDELLSNADVGSADIAKKIKIPLSTVQRRRRNLERMSVIKKNYELDLGIFGVRIAEISLEIKNGETQRVVSQLKSQKENQIVNTFLRVGDPQINASVVVVYKTSEQLFTIIESMKKNPNISRVSWSEYISKERNTQQIITTLLEETSKD